MDIFDNLILGLTTVASPGNLALLAVGVTAGMLVGVIPGLGPTAGLAILLPLTFSLDATGAIVMLAAVYYGSMYGGTITSVLINTPGESATVASTFDGYPLARKGRAGAALVMAAVASFVAGTVGAVLISVAAPVAASFATGFGPPELFLVVVLGLLTLIVVIGRNRLLGVISALIGFAVATVGIDIGGGQQRYTFGSAELITGVGFVPVAIGLFGVGELLYTLYRGGHKEKLAYFSVSPRDRAFWPTRSERKESRAPMVRGSLLGFGVGLTPGAGATVASLMSYSIEKAVSKRPKRFGKGAMAGLVGPEAANNAASQGSLVPLLSLGIPGSSATAVLLGGFLLWGLQPGPLLMDQNPEFAWGLIASMYLGNIMLLVVNVLCIPAFASVARVPFRVLAPTILVLCTLGTYTVHSSIVEVWIMLACGLLGFFMRLYGFSPAALVIALVLGPMAEESLRQSMIISNGSPSIFVASTTATVLVSLIAALLVLPLVLPHLVRLLRSRVAVPRRATPTPSGAEADAESDSDAEETRT